MAWRDVFLSFAKRQQWDDDTKGGRSTVQTLRLALVGSLSGLDPELFFEGILKGRGILMLVLKLGLRHQLERLSRRMWSLEIESWAFAKTAFIGLVRSLSRLGRYGVDVFYLVHNPLLCLKLEWRAILTYRSGVVWMRF